MNLRRLTLKSIVDYIRAKRLQVFYTVLWGFFVHSIIMAGFRPDPYLEHVRHIPPPHPYPIDLVVILIGVMILQLTLNIMLDNLVISRWKHFGMLIISTAFLLFFGMLAMHAPPPLTWMIMWQALSFILLAILCLVHLISFILSKVFKREMPTFK